MSSVDVRRPVALLMVVGLAALAFLPLAAAPSPSQAVSGSTTLLHDDFTHDTSLNATIWQVNGPVGSVVGPDDAGVSLVTLVPSFSSNGMEIAQVNASQEVGTIQSVENFTPPFTATAVVEGTVSNGHTFGFAVSSANASSGVLVYGNLNPTNCSNLGDCGDPAVCGNSANSNTPPNQCYYGIDAKVGKGSGSWSHVAKLYLTPSVDVIYTLQISVDASGNAGFSVSQGGQLLGQSTAQVGTGPFYIILEQAEGSPVARPGPNQAYWMSVSLAPTSTIISTTSSITTSASPGPSPGGISVPVWIIVIIVLLILFLIILAWYRRRSLTIDVKDSKRLSPISAATVSASGPENLSGLTDKEGRIVFPNPDKGDYTIRASARGYDPSAPVTISVDDKTKYVVKLDKSAGIALATAGAGPPPEVPSVSGPSTQMQPAPTVKQAEAPAPAPAVASAPQRQEQEESPELQGWGGDRIREIIRTFQEKGAVSPETALTAKELGLSRLFVRIMQRRKGRTRIFIEVNGRYYLDQEALKEGLG